MSGQSAGEVRCVVMSLQYHVCYLSEYVESKRMRLNSQASLSLIVLGTDETNSQIQL